MNTNLFDSFVKEQLADYRPQVPAHIWENIAAAKERKKPVGFWSAFSGMNLAAGILLILVAGGLLVYFFRHSSVPANDKTVNVQPAGTGATVGSNADVKQNQPADPNGDAATMNIPNNNITGSNQNNILYSGGQQNSNSIPGNQYTIGKIYSPGKIFAYIHNSGAETNTPFEDAGVSNNTQRTIPALLSNVQLLKTNILFLPRLRPGLLLPKNLLIPCPGAERNTAGNKKYIEVYGGPDYVFRSISDTSQSSYAQQRKESTKMAFAYSAGLRYTKVFGNGMSFRTGINYSRVNESFTYVQGHITRNEYIINNNGDTTGTYSVTGTQYNKSTNKFTSIDVPVMVGYEAGNGRLHTNINAGAMINVKSRETGYVLDKNGDPVDISSGKQATIYKYRTNTGVSLTAAISVYYKLTEHVHVLAEPYFKYSLSPVTQSELSLKQRYHTAGLRLGLRLDL